MLNEKQFDTPEITLNYAEGAANGAPMVMLHGTARWWHDWEMMTPRLENEWHVYAVDLRGHGQSGRAGDHYVLTDYARDVIALLRDRIGEPAVLVGQSLGAMVAMVVAAQAPDLVRALVLVEPPMGLAQDIGQAPEVKARFTRQRDMILAAPTFDAMLKTMTELRARAGLNDGMTEMAARCAFSVDPEVLNACIDNRLFEGIDRAEILDKISAPTLLFLADWQKGGATRPEDVEFVRAHVRNLTVFDFPGADHMLPFGKANELVDEMQKFLQPT